MNLNARPRLLVGLALGLCLATAACGVNGPKSATDGAGGQAPVPAPAAASGKVTGLGLVIEDSGKVQLCLGAVAESYPPQCSGVPLANWSWSGRNDFEDANGVKFATYAVTGTYDGTTLTVTDEPISAALYDPLPDPSAGRALSTRCAEPADGWRVTNPARATAVALTTAEETALGLDGYVTHWNDMFATFEVDGTASEPAITDDLGSQGTEDLALVLNVLVRGDVADATQRLRTVWGGALCVSNPLHTQRQLDQIARRLGNADAVASAFVQYDRVVAEVTYDDGSLQDYADATFGKDAVVIVSGLHTTS